MDWLTFFAEVIKALAWPLAVLIIFLFIRKPLLQLFPMLQRFRFRDIELDFSRQVQKLAAQALRELPSSLITETTEQFRTHADELAQLSPRAVVLEAWLMLEQAAIEATRRHDIQLTSQERRSPILLGQALVEAGILNESKQAIFHRLRNLRNAAAHASDFSFDPDSALEYADLAIRLTEYLMRA